MQALYEWRDRLSRSLDESTGYVLPNHMLLKLGAPPQTRHTPLHRPEPALAHSGFRQNCVIRRLVSWDREAYSTISIQHHQQTVLAAPSQWPICLSTLSSVCSKATELPPLMQDM